MKQLDFIALCGEYLLEPELVLENEDVREALAAKDDKKVKQLLRTEF